MKFEKNVGKVERNLRVVLGLVVGGVGLFTPGIFRLVLLVVASILIATGLVGFCAVYKVLGINTCKVEGKKS